MGPNHFPGHWNATAPYHDTDCKDCPAITQGGRIQSKCQTSLIARPQSEKPAEQGTETATDIELTAMISWFVLRIQIPLAQTLEHRCFLQLQELRQQSTDLIDPTAACQDYS